MYARLDLGSNAGKPFIGCRGFPKFRFIRSVP
jgi:hypothetical protein